MLLKARTRWFIPVNFIKTDLSEDYLERIDVGNNRIFIGESSVKMDNNSCKVMAINTTSQDYIVNIKQRENHDF